MKNVDFIRYDVLKSEQINALILKGRKNMTYVIRIHEKGEEKYVFSPDVLVCSIGYARKFSTFTYVKRYIKTHAAVSRMDYEIIPC